MVYSHIAFCLDCGVDFWAKTTTVNCLSDSCRSTNLDIQPATAVQTGPFWDKFCQCNSTERIRLWKDQFLSKNCAKSCEHCLLKKDCKLKEKK